MIILASDYDGTLHVGGGISERNLAEIREFQQAGNIFGIVTGRSKSMIEVELEACRDRLRLDFLIANTGGAVFDGEGRLLMQAAIPQDQVEALEQDLARRDVPMYGLASANGHCTMAERPLGAEGADVLDVGFEVLREYTREEVMTEGVLSFFLRGDTAEKSDCLQRELSASHPKLQFYFNGGTIDVMAEGVNKSSGISFVKDYFGAAAAYAIGNECNDIEMIEEFEGFAVAHSNPRVLAVKPRVVADVAEAIEILRAK